MVNKDGQIFMQLDGYYYQKEGQYRVLDTSDSSSAGNAAADKVVIRNDAGSIQTEKLAVSSGTTTKATMQYNSTEDCIEFIFA